MGRNATLRQHGLRCLQFSRIEAAVALGPMAPLEGAIRGGMLGDLNVAETNALIGISGPA